MDQKNTPLADALNAQSQAGTIAFDVPGHKGTLPEMVEFFGRRCLSLDKNSRASIDNLMSPSGVIRQAETLAAEAFGASAAFFMVGGTTSCVQSMILAVCQPGDSIILPRNIHASVLNGIILAGAIPVYMRPEISDEFGISLGVTVDEVKRLIDENPKATALLLNHPTYYGICSNLREIIGIAHEHNIKVLVDEAHGAHFYFCDELPVGAMRCGADMCAVSMHKTGGSLTQSSILLTGKNIDAQYIREIINLTLTTSSSYLLTASLDIARSFMATKGEDCLKKLIRSIKTAKEKINKLKGFLAFGKESFTEASVYAFDDTKLCVNARRSGYAGIEIYSVLRDRYGIQLEFGDIGNFLALPSMITPDEDLKKLTAALTDLDKSAQIKPYATVRYEYVPPIVKTSPRDAFFAPKKTVPIEESSDSVCGEFVMCYPPGIPILAPGELITQEALDLIAFASEKGCSITGLQDNRLKDIKVLK